MNIVKGILIGLLGAILMLCAIIGLSAVRPDLFEGFTKHDANEETASEIPIFTLPDGEPETEPSEPSISEDTVSEDTVSENDSAITDTYFSDNVPESGLKGGIESSYASDDTDAPANVPGELKSMTGFTEPHGTYDVMEDDKADEVETNLSTGPTGDDLSFDEEFYPYYHMLDDTGQHLYRQIYANAMELNPDFKAVEKSMPWASFKNVFEAVFNDHPELFWLNTEYSAGYRNNGECLEIVLSFNRTAKDIDASSSSFDQGANNIGNAAHGSEYEQEKAIHDTILDGFSYSKSAEMNQSAYCGFVNNSTVCAGYARCFQYIMQNLGIPCYYCRGVAGEPHAWNIIKLGGDYYNVDATWDDSDQTWQYEYFNLSDAEFNKDHRRTSLSVYLPACNGGQYSHLEQAPEDTVSDDNGDRDENSGNDPSELPEGTYVGSLEEYFTQCTNTIKSKGKGTYSFDLYTTDKEVYNSCMRSYANGRAKSEYMSDAFNSVEDPKGMSVDFVGTEEDGVYKMTQSVKLW